MFTSFVRGVLVLGIVLGVEGILIGIGLAFSRRRSNAFLKHILRGVSSVVVFSLAFWSFKSHLLDRWLDSLEFLVANGLVLGLLTFAVEGFVRVRIEHGTFRSVFSAFEKRSNTGIEREKWEQIKAKGKFRFVLMYGLGFGLWMINPAIVFSLVSPELVRPFWWPLVVLMFVFIGGSLGTFQWNSCEKKFGYKNY